MSFRGSLFHKQTKSFFRKHGILIGLYFVTSFVFVFISNFVALIMHLFLKVFFFHLWSYIQIQEALFFVDFYGDCLVHTNMDRQLFCFFDSSVLSSFHLFCNTNNSQDSEAGGRAELRFFFILLIFLCVAPSTATAGTLSKLSAQNNKSLNKKGYRSCSCYAQSIVKN